MKNSQKKDELMIKFQSSKIERVKLDKISGGQRQVVLATTATDVQTGVTSGGNHDNTNTPAD
ncbi:hypothetical protein SAMN05216324_113105 [Chryseobacterium limigenitum]|uniref:Uncharacterized protein n=2 Tax=Chryseobacterium limigenitum TaxID=1612149 RepID=A0A1K2IUN0_9FLAO|nr:hypothetical protein SAMN05216324_113105 [Chryseobacterium limigenitum]